MAKKRSFFEKICCCLCDDTDQNSQQQQNVQLQNIQQQQTIQPCLMSSHNNLYKKDQQRMGAPQINNVQKDKNVQLGVKRDFNLSLSQISGKEERLDEQDFKKYKYSCPICLVYFNRILKMKCCNNYVCFECEYDINQQMLNKKIESKCWWCKSENCEIIDVQDGEQIKNYSDAAQVLEDNNKKELQLIQSMVKESKLQRQSMLKTFKSQQPEDRQNPLMVKTVQSYNVDNLSNNLGTLNRNQWNNFNQNANNNVLRVDEEEEEKNIDRSGLNNKFFKTDSFQMKPINSNQIQHKSLNSPNNQGRIGGMNSSLCFNVQGQAMPIKLMQNNSLEQQYRKIDVQPSFQPAGYFFTQNQNNPFLNNQINNNYNNYFHQQVQNKEDDPYANGPNQKNKRNPNQIIQKALSSDDEINNREMDNQHNLHVPQHQQIQILNYDSDINDRV